MIRVFLLVILFFTSSFANPYKMISVQEQLNLFTNYFVNETLTSKLPPLPKKGTAAEHDYNYEPTKYEMYYNYVQRIKAIQDALADEQKELDDKYKADIYKYNKKLKALSKFYAEDKNLFPILNNSFNKALKVVYGKPLLSLQTGGEGIEFFLDTQPIYKDNQFTPLAIEFNSAKEKKMFNFYKQCDLSIKLKYQEGIVGFDEVICRYNDSIYQGKINQKNNEKIKLNVKINDDIFQQLEIKTSHKDKNK